MTRLESDFFWFLGIWGPGRSFAPRCGTFYLARRLLATHRLCTLGIGWSRVQRARLCQEFLDEKIPNSGEEFRVRAGFLSCCWEKEMKIQGIFSWSSWRLFAGFSFCLRALDLLREAVLLDLFLAGSGSAATFNPSSDEKRPWEFLLAMIHLYIKTIARIWSS